MVGISDGGKRWPFNGAVDTRLSKKLRLGRRRERAKRSSHSWVRLRGGLCGARKFGQCLLARDRRESSGGNGTKNKVPYFLSLR